MNAAPTLHSREIPCAGCRSILPPGAVFCVECGLCMLDVTGGGTVIARAPLRTTVGEITTPTPSLADLRRELDVPAMSGEYMILVDADIELLDEADADLIEIDSDETESMDLDRTVITRGPVAPRPYWDAPARGQTVVGPPPAPPRRVG